MAFPEGVGTIDETSRNFELVRTPFVPGSCTGIRSKLQEAFNQIQPDASDVVGPTLIEDSLPVDPTPVPDEDTQLFLAGKQGDQTALTTLEHRYAEQALNLAFRYIGDRQGAEDAVQEAWLLVFNSSSFDAQKKFGPYFIRTVVNHCLDILRKKKRRGVREYSLNDTGAFDCSPIENIEDPHGERTPTEFEDAANEFLAGIPPKYREVVELKAEGLNTIEIAKQIRREEATVRWRLNTAREWARMDFTQRGLHFRR